MEKPGVTEMIYELNVHYYVRAMRESDLSGPYPGWFEDQDVCKYNSHGKFFKNQEYFRTFYESLNHEDKVVWAICHVEEGHIGNVSLQEISPINRTAEFAIIVGNHDHWGKGVAYLAAMKLFEHGFMKLGLEKIYCGMAATNKGMIRLAEKAGMKQEGCRRSHLYLEGNRVDMLEYGVLREEFESLKGKNG
jgi:RimJ/RimL family protein N-acetyltransferase